MSDVIDVGSTLELKLNDFTVANGVVTEISEGKVYIDIPATRVVMGLRTSLGEPPAHEPEVEHQLAGMATPANDGGSEAQDAVNNGTPVQQEQFTNVPPPSPEQQRQQPAQQIPVSNDSLRNQQLDSSILD